MKKQLSLIDQDSGRTSHITIDRGPADNTVRITFGASFSIALSDRGARELAVALAAAAPKERSFEEINGC